MKRITILFAVTLSFITALTFPQLVEAKTAVSSAALATPFAMQKKVEDNRTQLLQGYLESRNSPLAPYAKVFVDEADKNNLDWKFVAAIAGLESGFGQNIPAYSYNAWGYGIYGNNVRRFATWEEGITVVSGAIRKDYMNKRQAQNIYEIGRMYAASPTWASRVQNFMDQIDAFEIKEPTTLGISL